MPKQPRPIMVETDSDLIHYPRVGNKHWMFDPRLADVVNQLTYFPFDGTRDSIPTNIDCMCWEIKMEGS